MAGRKRKRGRTSFESWLKIIYIIAVPILLLYLRQNPFWQPWIYPDYGVPLPKGEVLYGLDISHHQGPIDWSLISTGEKPIHFVFMKATEGITFSDPRFEDNWKNAKAIGIKRGAYHFFRPGVNATLQAQNFLSALGKDIGELPPVLDVEVHDRKTDEHIRSSVLNWLETVEKGSGAKPIIYTNMDYYHRIFALGFEEYPLWVARYRRRHLAVQSEDRRVHFWQFTDRALVNGIEGKVDMNVFFGDSLDLEIFAQDE